MIGNCRICGETRDGMSFSFWVKDTFTNYDLLKPGEIICNNCLFWFDQKSVLLQEKMGKDKPQKMQNYSHFIKNEIWIPVSKGNKKDMIDLLICFPFPELAAIADSGQKHLAFRAPRNPKGNITGWIQFEEQKIFINPIDLMVIINNIEKLYTTFSKNEILTGNYYPHRIIEYGMFEWENSENKIKNERGSGLFALALFLSQKKEKNEKSNSGSKEIGSNAIKNNMEGNISGLQESLQN